MLALTITANTQQWNTYFYYLCIYYMACRKICVNIWSHPFCSITTCLVLCHFTTDNFFCEFKLHSAAWPNSFLKSRNIAVISRPIIYWLHLEVWDRSSINLGVCSLAFSRCNAAVPTDVSDCWHMLSLYVSSGLSELLMQGMLLNKISCSLCKYNSTLKVHP